MSRKKLPKIEVHAVAWTAESPLKYQCILSYYGLRLISDPMPTPIKALVDMRRLLNKQQDFVQTAIDNWERISSAKLPLEILKVDNGKVTSLRDFV